MPCPQPDGGLSLPSMDSSGKQGSGGLKQPDLDTMACAQAGLSPCPPRTVKQQSQPGFHALCWG